MNLSDWQRARAKRAIELLQEVKLPRMMSANQHERVRQDAFKELILDVLDSECGKKELVKRIKRGSRRGKS